MLRKSAPHLLRLILFSVLLFAVWWAKESLGLELDPTQLRAVDAAWSPRWIGAFFVFWIVAQSVLWPTLAGGILFGWAGGIGMNLLGAAVAAAVQLVVFRTFLRAPAEAWFGQRLRVLAAAVEHRGVALLVIWRMLWLPVSWLTVATALTRIPLWQHVAAVLAMIPGMIAITGMADAMVVEGPTGVPLWRWGLLVAVFAASLAVWGWAQRHYPALSVLRSDPDED